MFVKLTGCCRGYESCIILLAQPDRLGLIPPADEVGHQDDDDHGGEDTAHYDGDQVIGALAIRGTVTGGLNKNLYQISD